jgi:uncharacterized membrane protein
MTLLILGLILFFAAHSVRIYADAWRSRQIARRGEQVWKGVYALVSLAGLVLLVWGYSAIRAMPELWSPPVWTRHLAALLTLPAFVLLVAAYLPGSRIKAVLGHPMLAGVKLWAFAHLLANGRGADILLFGAFLLWAVVAFVSARRRDRAAGVHPPAGSLRGDLAVTAVGAAAWAAFALWGHAWLIGVRPF